LVARFGGGLLVVLSGGRAGLRRGRPLADDAVARARLTLRQRLANPDGARSVNADLGSLFADVGLGLGLTDPAPGGWMDAGVAAQTTENPDGTVDVKLAIDAGERLEVEVEAAEDGRRMGPGLQRTVGRALGLGDRMRITAGFVEEAPRRVARALAREGYLDATARIVPEDTADGRRLRVIVDRGRRHRRRAVRFVGNEVLSDSQLRTVLNQASPEVLRRRRLTDEALQSGLRAAEALYASAGYQDATLRAGEPLVTRRVWGPSRLWDRASRWVAVAVRVEEGPRTDLQRLDLVGADPAVDLSRIRAVVEELEGGPWSPQGVQALSRRVVDAYRAAGFLEARARVRSEAVAPERVTAVLEVDPGPQILLRSFATRGNRRVSGEYLRRTLAPPLGTPVTAETLATLRERLYALDMFGGVELSLLGDGVARDLVVDLRERARHTVQAGVGLATDQGIRALGRWTVRNLLGPADRADTNALVGLPFRNPGTGNFSDVLPGFRPPELRLGSSYSTPLSRRTDLTLTAIPQEEVQERNWRSLRSALGLLGELQPSRATRVQLAARLEVRRLRDADPGAILATDVWRRIRRVPSQDAPLDMRPGGRLVDTLEAVGLVDLRDNPLQPTRGGLVQVRGAVSPGLLQAAWNPQLRVPVVALEARTSGVVPLGRVQLQLNVEGGLQRVAPVGRIEPFTVDGESVRPAVPVEQRYRLGGTASLRGFRRDGVGPLNRTAVLPLDWPDTVEPVVDWALEGRDTRWVPTGGDTFFRATADLLVPLPALGLTDWEGYDLALFADVGQAWFGSATPVSSRSVPEAPRVRLGTGVGLRVVTPVGPLQADLAVNPEAAAAGIRQLQGPLPDGSRAALLREQWEEPPVRVHLSLGSLF